MWEFIANLFSDSNLQLGLMIGTGILAVSLLVLALTRWGQSSPVWKCVILSFAAHILLMIYAYGTQLIFEYPDPGLSPHEHLRVNILASGDELALDTGQIAAVPAWKETPQEDLPEVIEPLARPDIDSEIVIQRVLSEPVAIPEMELSTEDRLTIPLAQVPDFSPILPPQQIELEPLPTKLDSPEMPVERKQEPDVAQHEPPPFLPSEEFSKVDSANDFQPSQSAEIVPNPHQPGLDSNLLNPDSQFAQQTELLPLPPRPLPESLSHQSLSPAAPDARFKRVSTAWRPADGKPLPEVYSLRSAADRQQIVQERGGSAETEAAVKEGLRWLVQSQETDGRWDADRWGAGTEKQVLGHDRKGAGAEADTGITGLATLALLAAGHSHLEGDYQETIQRALDFLIRQQSSNGDLAGTAKLFARTYCHSMALLALSEALAVTGDRKLLHAVQRGVDFSVHAQNRLDGGWRYQPGDPGDMSQHGWQVLALKSAQMGGAQVPAETFDRMRKFVDSCARGSFGGLSSYRPRQGVSTSMTAEALVCRFVLNGQISHESMMEAADRISTERPNSLNVNLYYWYYGTLAMYQVGGHEWQTWNTEMKKALLSSQVRSGSLAGSWSPDCLWAGYGGRVYATALATLNLQVYYRYLPNNRTAAIVPESQLDASIKLR